VDEKVDVRETASKSDARDNSPSGDRASADGPATVSPHKGVRAEQMSRMLDPAVLGGLTIELAAQLGRGTMTIDDLARLGSGEVVRLDTPLNGVVDLTLNGTLVARGEIVAVDDQFGVRVTEIFVRPQ
jgi:flagellar motor switch protein FliN/FliY